MTVPTAVTRATRQKARDASPSPSAHPSPSTPEQAAGFDGKAAAARYVEECLKESKGVNRTLVGQYLGTNINADINKFVVTTQDAYRERSGLTEGGRPRKGEEARIEANFARLAQAIHGGDDDDDAEPSDAELRRTEKTERPKPAPTAKERKRDAPHWWTESAARYCPRCHMLIQPRYYANSGMWEPKSSYDERKSCGRECPKATK